MVGFHFILVLQIILLILANNIRNYPSLNMLQRFFIFNSPFFVHPLSSIRFVNAVISHHFGEDIASRFYFFL